jgi:hypothetical protein
MMILFASFRVIFLQEHDQFHFRRLESDENYGNKPPLLYAHQQSDFLNHNLRRT